MFGVTVQFTGMLAEYGWVAPDAREIGLEGVIETGGSRLIVAAPEGPIEGAAVIVAVRALLGIGVATVNVTF